MEPIVDFERSGTFKVHSLRFKVLAIVLVVLFAMIPLFEISPETFPLNQGFGHYYVHCGCFGCY